MDIWLLHHNGNIGRAETYRGVKIRDHNDIIYVSLQIFRIEIVYGDNRTGTGSKAVPGS